MNFRYVFFEVALAAAVFAVPRILEGIAEPQLSGEAVRYTAPQEPAEQPVEEPAVVSAGREVEPEDAPPADLRDMARLFSVPRLTVEKVEPGETVPDTPPAAEAPLPAAALPGDDRFRFLGIIRDAHNGERLYLKEGETGALIAVGMEDVIDRTAEAYLIRLGDTIFSIRRD
jgi:hypothetical protein